MCCGDSVSTIMWSDVSGPHYQNVTEERAWAVGTRDRTKRPMEFILYSYTKLAVILCRRAVNLFLYYDLRKGNSLFLSNVSYRRMIK
ncbi:hypothetical protein RBTH_03763 [Bacillus thuringiensis serovar israelensis ATCC 35646]|nr:hypothetical protein RBTH_03763 [Bacillus thuringiensis serovar israelensis ATCC 35646]